MKTLGDIERWLKNAGCGYNVEFYFGKDKFGVNLEGAYIVNGESKTIEGAFENAIEELRRKAGGQGSVRNEVYVDGKINKAPSLGVFAAARNITTTGVVSVKVSGNYGAAPINFSGLAPSTPKATAANMQFPVCPTCSALPSFIVTANGSTMKAMTCGSYHTWMSPLAVGDMIKVDSGAVERWDGVCWRPVP